MRIGVLSDIHDNFLKSEKAVNLFKNNKMEFVFSFPPQELDLMRRIYCFAQKRKVKLYLVGGILRDLFLKRTNENPDLDFCLKKNAIAFGNKLTRELRCGFVILDKERGACRLVKKIKDRVYTLDFTDFRGKAIADDLLRRDFTINAMAVELEKIIKPSLSKRNYLMENLNDFLIDPYQGRQDLKSKIIRTVNKKGFDDDPLRILRAFSFSAMLGFTIDKVTLKLASLKAQKLTRVSFERIRDELFKILDGPNSFESLVKLDHSKLLGIIFPEIETMRGLKQGPYHHLDVLKHTLEAIRQLEILIQELKNNQELQNYLNEVISGERKRSAILKLGVLLHDIGKPPALRHEDGKTKFHGHERIGQEITREIVQRLRLSNDELDSLSKMVFWHLRPGYLADNEEITPRATFRYFRDAAQEGVSILLISIADQRATKGPLTSLESRIHHEKVALDLIKEYFRNKKKKKIERLINGDDLIKKFKLEPSILIGKILREVEELQAIGKIRNKTEALRIAKKMIGKKKKGGR